MLSVCNICYVNCAVADKYSYEEWKDRPELIPKGRSYYEVLEYFSYINTCTDTLSVCLVGVLLFRSFSSLGLLSQKMLGVGFPHVAITNQA